MPKKRHISIFGYRIGRFLFLLLSMVLLFVVRPFLQGHIGIRLLMEIFFTLVLLSGAYAVSQKRSTFVIGLALLIPGLVASWATHFLALPKEILIVGLSFEGLFLAYTSIVILYSIFAGEREITADTIFGAICVYFLIGLVWAIVFFILENLQPGSFQIPEDYGTTISHFVYYSYVTMTTLGYGDITPISAPARSLALLEAITGQLYLAIMIAGLVAIYISQSLGKETK